MAAVLCLIDRRANRLAQRLQAAGHHVYQSFTADHAVSMCVNHYIDVAVLDQAIFVETDCWSVAQSIKSVRPSVQVVLMTRGIMIADQKPLGVDALLGHGALPELLQYLESLEQAARSATREAYPQPVTETIQ